MVILYLHLFRMYCNSVSSGSGLCSTTYKKVHQAIILHNVSYSGVLERRYGSWGGGNELSKAINRLGEKMSQLFRQIRGSEIQVSVENSVT